MSLPRSLSCSLAALAISLSLFSCGADDSGPDATTSSAGGASASSGGTDSGSGGGGAGAGGVLFGTGGATNTGGTATITGGDSGGGGAPTSSGGTTESGGASTNSGGNDNGTGGLVDGAGGSDVDYDPCPSDGSACKIMPFGDSITDGFNPTTPGGYRVELFRQANAGGKNITFVGSGWNGPDTVDGVAFPHNHEGHSGWTIAPAGGRSGISTLVDVVMPEHMPHIVLLMIGTNDAIDNFEMATADARLGALIDSIYAQLPDILIIVAKPIPSRGDTGQGDDGALTARIETFNSTIPQVVQQRADAGKHILLVDMFTPFAPNKGSLLADQWHPNAAGYELLGAEWYQALEPYL